MRRPTSVLTMAILGTALMVPDLPAQQLPPTGASPAAGAPPAVTSTMLARGARYLLRNGWDYINYQEYERALGFFREAETRKAELNKDEIKSLYQGIAKAQEGMRDPSNTSTRTYARSGKRRPGALSETRLSPVRDVVPQGVERSKHSDALGFVQPVQDRTECSIVLAVLRDEDQLLDRYVLRVCVIALVPGLRDS